VRSLGNVGAYAIATGTAIYLMIGPWVQTSVYHVPVIDFHQKAVLTNTMPTSAYRGAGRPEAIHNMERLMDEAARVTGIDRITLRRRNFIRPEQMPYKNPMGQTYDTGQFEKVMDAALKQADWAGFDARAAHSKAEGKWRGLGISTFLEWTGGNVLEERVTVSVLANGVIEVFSAVNQMGQGIATTLAQLVVDAFGVPLSQVRVVLGDTDRGDGFGSAGSRSIFTGGSSIRVGSERMVDHARTLAAKELEAAVEDITYEAGRYTVKGTDVGISIFEVAAKQDGQRIDLENTTTATGPTWPNGCHISEVEIDPATGVVRIDRFTAVDDFGTIINPMIVEGQVHGGLAQGIGQALLENCVYDKETGQLLTGSFMDYAMPRADDFPQFKLDHVVTPCTHNPLGTKGCGEAGAIGSPPAVINAVLDALHGLGVKEFDMPASPSRVWEAIQSAKA